MPAVTACIFDLDGVIVDTAVYHYRAWKRLANTLGFDITEQQNEELKGVSRMRSLELVLGWGNVAKNDEEKLALATLKNNWYVEMISRMTPAEILPGAQEFLLEVRKNGMSTALGSASKNAPLILGRTGLKDLFDVVVDGNMVHRSKPDPEVFIKGAALLNADPENCVVFEDAAAGIEAALNAGMRVVGIGKKEQLTNAGLVVSGLHEMTTGKLMEMRAVSLQK
jgi:beta-phosphoglucomutase